MEEAYINHLKTCFLNAESEKSNLTPEILAMEGMTGCYTRHFYNNLLSFSDTRYLEIGCYTGSSTVAAMYGNSATITCIDNWHDFYLNQAHNNVDPGGPITEFMNNIVKYKGENKVTFQNKDCFAIDVNNLGKFNMYLYDAGHTHDEQYKAITYYLPALDDTFILIVDDWNIDEVRSGTIEAIKDTKLQIVWDKEIRRTWNNKHTHPDLARATWWNGIYVAVCKKNTA